MAQNTFGQDITQAGGSIVPTVQPAQVATTGSLQNTLATPQNQNTTTPSVPNTTSQPQTPSIQTPAGPGLDATSFADVINGVKQNFAANNDLINAKNLLMKGLFTSPLSADQLAQLPPDIQQVYNSGNKDAIELQIQALNERIQGGTNNFAQSVNYLVNGYQTSVKQAQDQKAAALDTLFKVAQNFVDPKTGTIDVSKMKAALQASYPGIDISGVVDQLNGLTPTSAYTSTLHYGTAQTGSSSVTIPSGTIASQTNNPLNIKYVAGNTLGGADSGLKAQDGGTFASFKSPQDGLSAAINLLKSSTYSGLSIDQAMKKWSNSGYGAEVSPSMNPDQKISSLSATQVQQLVTDMAKRESGATVNNGVSTIDVSPPDPKTANTVNAGIAAGTNNTPNGIYQAATEYMFTGKMPSIGLGQNGAVVKTRNMIISLAGGLAAASGTNFPALQALYKANSSAATQNVQRLARVESVLQATTLNFPRLEQLANSLKQNGLNITESDIQAGAAKVAQKFGSTDAAAYVELINTLRNDYSAAQAALAGSRGGQFFAAAAQEAIPTGLTADQYEAIKNTINLSSNNAATAINSEVNNLLGVSGDISGNNSSGNSNTTNDPLGLGI